MLLSRPCKLVGAALTALVVLAGCGNPTATRRMRPPMGGPVVQQRPLPPAMPQAGAPGMLPGQQPGMMPQAGGIGARQMPEVDQMRMALHAAQQRVPGFSATIETFDKGPKGQESNSMRVTFRKPSSLKIEMTKAVGQAQGAKILWTGGDSLRIKPSFLPMSVEKSISDEQTKSKNGWTIKDTEVNAIIRVLLDPNAQIKALGVHPIEGRPLSAFEVRSRLSPRGASHEVVGMDGTTGLPAARLIFKGNDIIYKAIIKNMSIRNVSSAEMSL